MRSSLFRRNGDHSEASESDPLLPGSQPVLPSVTVVRRALEDEGAINPTGLTNYRVVRIVEHSDPENNYFCRETTLAPDPTPALKVPQYYAAIMASFGAFAVGTMLGWSAPVMYQINQPNSTVYNFPITPSEGDIISSIVNFGAAVACYPAGVIMDAIGRRKLMLFFTIPFTVGWLFVTLATDIRMLIIGRFLTGIAGGSFCVTVPAYISEIAEVSIRGTLGSYFQLMVTIGILFSYVIGSYVRVMTFNILCVAVTMILGLELLCIPESPNFLLLKGRIPEAVQAMRKLRGENYDPSNELQSNLTLQNMIPFRESMRQKASRKAFFICLALMLFQQLSGINAVLFNISSIFENSSTMYNPATGTILIGAIQVLATFLSSKVVDRLGRRYLLLTSSFFMGLCTCATGVYFYLKEHNASGNDWNSLSWIPLWSLTLFIIAFSFGFGPIPWLMAGELCRHNIKGVVTSFSGSLNWSLSLAVTSSFNSMSKSIGTGQVFWLYTSSTVLAFVFVLFVVPETKGRSVEEIQELLGGEPQQVQPDVPSGLDTSNVESTDEGLGQ